MWDEGGGGGGSVEGDADERTFAAPAMSQWNGEVSSCPA